jgi:hypothetical protein
VVEAVRSSDGNILLVTQFSGVRLLRDASSFDVAEMIDESEVGVVG